MAFLISKWPRDWLWCKVTFSNFQLYSDGTEVQFPNFDLLPGTKRHGQLGVFSVPSLPRHGHGTSEDAFYLLAIRGLTRGEGKPGIEPGSSDPKSSPLPLRHRGGPNDLEKISCITAVYTNFYWNRSRHTRQGPSTIICNTASMVQFNWDEYHLKMTIFLKASKCYRQKHNPRLGHLTGPHEIWLMK